MDRATRQRDAIEAVLESAGRPLSPTEVLERTREVIGTVGLATVYRNLKRLAEVGVVHPVDLPGEGTRYEVAPSHHHHHFQCLECRRVFDTRGCPGDLRRLAPPGFSVERHEVTLYGRCPSCRPRSVKRRRE
jgi:Fur family ferric uptake transcriptional regulator